MEKNKKQITMKIEKFEDILSWQKAKTLNIMLYKYFQQSHDFVFRDQILRASLSIMNNIAEGFERKSNRQFLYFLYIAKGSCGEVRSMCILARELGKMNNELADQLDTICIDISKLIRMLILSIENRK